MEQEREQIKQKLLTQASAYKKLAQGADTLIAQEPFWTERLLLRLTRRLATHRLRQLTLILPPDDMQSILVDE